MKRVDHNCMCIHPHNILSSSVLRLNLVHHHGSGPVLLPLRIFAWRSFLLQRLPEAGHCIGGGGGGGTQQQAEGLVQTNQQFGKYVFNYVVIYVLCNI